MRRSGILILLVLVLAGCTATVEFPPSVYGPPYYTGPAYPPVHIYRPPIIIYRWPYRNYHHHHHHFHR